MGDRIKFRFQYNGTNSFFKDGQ